MGRPVPRPARAHDQDAGQRLQADANGCCLLARVREEPPAAARLRHRLAVEGRDEGVSRPVGRGGEARPPQARAELDLFSFPDEIGSGLAVFHPKGGVIRKTMEDYSRQRHEESGYEFVYSPHITKANLFQTSGHLDWYAESMYPPMHLDEERDAEGHIKRQGQD